MVNSTMSDGEKNLRKDMNSINDKINQDFIKKITKNFKAKGKFGLYKVDQFKEYFDCDNNIENLSDIVKKLVKDSRNDTQLGKYFDNRINQFVHLRNIQRSRKRLEYLDTLEKCIKDITEKDMGELRSNGQYDTFKQSTPVILRDILDRIDIQPVQYNGQEQQNQTQPEIQSNLSQENTQSQEQVGDTQTQNQPETQPTNQPQEDNQPSQEQDTQIQTQPEQSTNQPEIQQPVQEEIEQTPMREAPFIYNVKKGTGDFGKGIDAYKKAQKDTKTLLDTLLVDVTIANLKSLNSIRNEKSRIDYKMLEKEPAREKYTTETMNQMTSLLSAYGCKNNDFIIRNRFMKGLVGWDINDFRGQINEAKENMSLKVFEQFRDKAISPIAKEMAAYPVYCLRESDAEKVAEYTKTQDKIDTKRLGLVDMANLINVFDANKEVSDEFLAQQPYHKSA